MISYNLRGVTCENLGPFLQSMKNEFEADVLLIQEFTKAIKNPLPQHLDGWLVIANATTSGVRVPGAAVSPALSDFVTEDPTMCGDDVVSFVLHHPLLGDIYFVTAHLDATTSRDAYAQSLANLDFLLGRCPSDAALCCGIDANTSLYGVDLDEEVLVGPNILVVPQVMFHGRRDYYGSLW